MKRGNRTFLILVAVLFSVIVSTMIIWELGKPFYPLLAIPLVFVDISLTYRTYKLMCEKHPDANSDKFIDFEANQVIKPLIREFGIGRGGLLGLAIVTAVAVLAFSQLNDIGLGFVAGVYSMVFVMHLTNIADGNSKSPVTNGEKHIASCCNMEG